MPPCMSKTLVNGPYPSQPETIEHVSNLCRSVDETERNNTDGLAKQCQKLNKYLQGLYRSVQAMERKALTDFASLSDATVASLLVLNDTKGKPQPLMDHKII